MSFITSFAAETPFKALTDLMLPPSREASYQGVNAFLPLCSVFDGNSTLVLNLATDQSDEGGATTLGNLRATPAMLEVATLLSTKAYIASNGSCVAPANLAAEVRSFGRYAAAQGLTTEDAIDRTVFVENPLHYRAVLKELATRGLYAIPYMSTVGFSAIAQETATMRNGADEHVSSLLVNRFADKSEFRDFLSSTILELYPSLRIEGLLDYPRIKLRRGEFADCEDLTVRLIHAASYYAGTPQDSSRVLFVQVADAAGGNGNLVVYREEGQLRVHGFDQQEHVFTGDTERERFCALASYLAEASRDLDLEITPFLSLLQSYSISIMVNDSQVGILGPRIQILDPENHSFLGSSFDRYPDTSRFVRLDAAMSLAVAFGQELREHGFRGHTDIDVIEYVDHSGDPRVSVSESNMRRNAPSHLVSLLVRIPEFREQLALGEISFLLDDHVHVAAHHLKTRSESEGLTEHLAHLVTDSGLPLSSVSNPEGVIFMSPPLRNAAAPEKGALLSLAVLSADDRRKHAIYDRVKRFLEN